jgi:hypothetical protein
METENTQRPAAQEPEETEEGSPVPDPERNADENDAEDVPTAD